MPKKQNLKNKGNYVGTLLVKFRNKDCKTTELGLLLQVLPVRIVTFVETLGIHLKSSFRSPTIFILFLSAGKPFCYVIFACYRMIS